MTYQTYQQQRSLGGSYLLMNTHAADWCQTADMPDLFGNHSQLLKVYQALHHGVITEMNERQVFLHQREKWNLSTAK